MSFGVWVMVIIFTLWEWNNRRNTYGAFEATKQMLFALGIFGFGVWLATNVGLVGVLGLMMAMVAIVAIRGYLLLKSAKRAGRAR